MEERYLMDFETSSPVAKIHDIAAGTSEEFAADANNMDSIITSWSL